MSDRPVRTARGPVQGTFRAMPSKSVTHRGLVVASLASGPSVLVDPLEADDTIATRDGLSALGVPVEVERGRWTVHGRGGRIPGGGTLQLRESGTSMRLLLAVAALGDRGSVLDGSPRLRERPLRELVEALERIGGRLAPLGTNDGLPIEAGGALPRGGRVEIAADRSSQFASALLLVGARLPRGLELALRPPAVSLPYVALSVRVLEQFGVHVERGGPLLWRVPPGEYPGREYRIEGDHSSASYFLAAAAMVGGKVRVVGIDPDSQQPDARLRRILEGLGCTVRTSADWIEVEGTGRIPPFDIDVSDAPDLVPTLAVLALFADGPSTLRGIAHLRLKESDRLQVLAGNLSALGRPSEALPDSLVIGPTPESELRGGRILTESDHRMAMAFAVAGLRLDGLVVDDASCVAKSNPEFWSQFERLETGVG